MVNSSEGITRGQQVSKVMTRQSSNTQRNQEQDNKKLQENNEKIKKDELSSKNLREQLEEEIKDMNNIMESIEENLTFKLHEETDRIMTQIIDIQTKEVIKEMPPEEMLDLSARISKMVGLILDEEV